MHPHHIQKPMIRESGVPLTDDRVKPGGFPIYFAIGDSIKCVDREVDIGLLDVGLYVVGHLGGIVGNEVLIGAAHGTGVCVKEGGHNLILS